MKIATRAAQRRADTKLLVLNENGIAHHAFWQLPNLLRSGDLLVVNDAATIPASFSGVLRRTQEPVELRLATAMQMPRLWEATLFGAGDWRTPTEFRPRPPSVQVGDVLDFRFGLVARVLQVSELSPSFLRTEFLSVQESLWSLIYKAGVPIQYSYLQSPIAAWDQQTIFAGPPAALEPPSASFPFSWKMIFELQRRGVQLAALTHAAGISTTGDPTMDALLPLPERYTISESTAHAVNRALAENRRVIAVGTAVTRALESAANADGKVRAETAVTSLRITSSHRRRIVSGIFTGFHEMHASHLQLLSSFVDPAQLDQAYREAEDRDYLWHEYGDVCLIV